jgi:hypothetical protein
MDSVILLDQGLTVFSFISGNEVNILAEAVSVDAEVEGAGVETACEVEVC